MQSDKRNWQPYDVSSQDRPSALSEVSSYSKGIFKKAEYNVISENRWEQKGYSHTNGAVGLDNISIYEPKGKENAKNGAAKYPKNNQSNFSGEVYI